MADIKGTDYNDYLFGTEADDTLVGGKGNDQLEGGLGNDIYVFDRGDGQDTILQFNSSYLDQDFLQLGVGIGLADVEFGRDEYSNALTVKLTGTNDSVRIEGYFDRMPQERLNIVFADGAMLDGFAINTKINNYGVFSEGTSDSETLVGGNGHDYLLGNDGNDILHGDAGMDYMDGGFGNDTYVFGRGDGQDVIVQGYSGAAGMEKDKLKLGSGIGLADVEFSREEFNNDLIVKIASTGDRVRIQDYFAPAPFERMAIVFADGAVLDGIAIDRKVYGFGGFIEGTFGNDTLAGGSSDDYLYGGSGDDILHGDAGNDHMEGGSGNDTYFFGRGDGQDTILQSNNGYIDQDKLRLGSGIFLTDVEFSRDSYSNALILTLPGTSDSVRVEGYFDQMLPERMQIVFADGAILDGFAMEEKLNGYGGYTDGTSANDTLVGGDGDDNIYGHDGNDLLYGDGGNDQLEGGIGNDTYLFGRGDGQDRILQFYTDYLDQDKLQLGSSIGLADVQFRRDDHGSALIVEITGSNDSVRIEGYFDRMLHERMQIVFADGAALDGFAIDRKLVYGDDYLGGTSGNDTIVGGLGNDILHGMDGDDALYGDEGSDHLNGSFGNDILTGGAGGDWLHGGEGNDTYVFNRGDGKDVIVDGDASAFDAGPYTDTIQFGSGIKPNDIEFVRTASDLVLKIKGTEDELTIVNWPYENGHYRVEQIAFADGTVWDAAYIQNQIELIPILGTEFDDNLRAHEWSADGDIDVAGLNGNDSLYGNSGENTLSGGKGDDWLFGSGGNDTYLFTSGDGQDTIVNYTYSDNESNTILFGAGITSDQIEFVRINGNVVLSVKGTSDRITVSNWVNDAYRIDRIVFIDGTVWDAEYLQSQIESISLVGTNEADSLQAWSGLNDSLSGLQGNDSLYGNEHSNMLDGGEGSDLLVGNQGSDTLTGGAGDDTYAFNLGDGVDVIHDVSTLDEGNAISFGPGIFLDSLRFEHTENTLTIRYSDTDAIILPNFNLFNESGNLGVAKLVFNTGDGNVHTVPLAEQVNRAPIATAIGSQNATEDAYFEFHLPTGAFSDPNPGDNLTLSAMQITGAPLPAWLTFDPVKNAFRGTPGNDAVGTLYIAVTATDKLGKSASEFFTITVGNTNDAPIAIDDTLRASERQIATIATSALLANDSDADVNDAKTLINVASQSAKGANISFENGIVSYHPDELFRSLGAGQTASDSFVYTIADAAGATSSATVHVTVIGSNDAPVVASELTNQDLMEDAAFSFAIPPGCFTEIDASDTLTYRATLGNGDALPSWISFDAATGAFAGVAGNSQVGDHSITVTATDSSGASASSSFTVTVINTNDAPILLSPIIDQTAQDTVPFSFTLPADTFADIDFGDAMLLSATLVDGSALPTWLSFDHVTRSFSGTPSDVDLGMLNVLVTATDEAGLAVSDSFALAVGAAPDRMITGTSGSDTLTGASGNDTIDGGSGADTMRGKQGNDTYIVQGSNDVVIENADEGTDMIKSSISWTLSSTYEIENLALTGTNSISGTGNALDNVVIGNSNSNTLTGKAGNDTLDGGTGADTMRGGTGNDLYIVDNSSDKTVEYANEGTDTVRSSVSHTLKSNIEALFVTGSNAINGYGNGLNNLLVGNSNNNILGSSSTSSGIDILQGGGGNDTLLDNSGNAVLDGGAGTDTLTGGSGRELFIGGTGNDTITTGSGADIIAFNKGDGQDIVNASTGKDNTISLGNVDYADLLFKKNGSDLILGIGAFEQITLKGWYSSTNNRNVATLQMVIEGTSDYQPGSSITITDHKIEQFDFVGLAAKFDEARTANSELTSWNLSASLLEFHLGGSDTTAIGGDLTYQYAINGNLSNLSMSPVQAVLSDTSFSTTNQNLQANNALQDMSARLI